MLMTLIQKEITHHILSVRFCRAPCDVSPSRPTHTFYQLPKLSPELSGLPRSR